MRWITVLMIMISGAGAIIAFKNGEPGGALMFAFYAGVCVGPALFYWCGGKQ